MKKPLEFHAGMCVAVFSLSLFSRQLQAAQLVEISAKIETFGYRLADTNSIARVSPIPLLLMEDVPLRDALKNLSRRMDFALVLDLSLSSPPHDKTLLQEVSISWARATARQLWTNNERGPPPHVLREDLPSA
jgi:hypothetical protein